MYGIGKDHDVWMMGVVTAAGRQATCDQCVLSVNLDKFMINVHIAADYTNHKINYTVWSQDNTVGLTNKFIINDHTAADYTNHTH